MDKFSIIFFQMCHFPIWMIWLLSAENWVDFDGNWVDFDGNWIDVSSILMWKLFPWLFRTRLTLRKIRMIPPSRVVRLE